jgi:hypothetical protein
MLEKEILYLSIATALIIVILSIILTYLIVRKAIEIRHNSKIEAYKNQYREHIFTFLMNGEFSDRFISNTIEKKLALEDLLSRYSEVLEGENEKKNLYILAELYLAEYYKNLLKSRKWSKRMNGLFRIEDFHIRSLELLVKDLVNRKKLTKSEQVLGLRILALFEDETLYDKLITNHSTLSEFDYRSILYKANETLIERFVLGFYQCQPALQYAILDILALKNELKYASFLETVYKSNSGEIRLRALKALASIGFVKNLNEFLPLCQSGKWQERMMLAKLLGAIGEVEGLKCLEELLHDSTWWVRSQAAQSMKNYPNGTSLLKMVYETSKDPYAKDMAREWMNKGE